VFIHQLKLFKIFILFISILLLFRVCLAEPVLPSTKIVDELKTTESRAAIAIMDSKIRVDSKTPSVTLMLLNDKNKDNSSPNSTLGAYDLGLQAIVVSSTNGSTETIICILHELGHWIDASFAIHIKTKENWFSKSDKSKSLNKVYANSTFVRASQTIIMLSRANGDKKAETFFTQNISPVELFGKSFAQWLIFSQNDTKLKEQFQVKGLNGYPRWAWGEEEFVPISKELDTLFNTYKWTVK
jgi:hypothetical protein